VPGIESATASSGRRVGSRVYIAGILLNTPDNMIAWLRNP